MKTATLSHLSAAIWVLSLCESMSAQTAGTLTGTVLEAQQLAVAHATVRITNGVTRFVKEIETDADGRFAAINLPLESYAIQVQKNGFTPWSQTIAVRSAVPVNLAIALSVATETQAIVVGDVDALMLVKSEETGTRVQMNQSDIDKMAFATANRGVEAIMVTFPGFMQNANGAIHPRGAHNQMLWVIDGMPIGDQLTGAFANAIDPSIVQTVELHMGNIPAEFGNKVAAVANLTTLTGMGVGRRFSGSITTSAAQFNTLTQSTQVAGQVGKLGYSGVYSAMASTAP
jgi:hypothetical protein